MLIFLICVAIFSVDQITKAIIFSCFREGIFLPVIGGLFSIRPVHNTGAAFSLFEGANLPLIIVSILAIVIMSAILIKKRLSRPFNIAIALLITGALGNLVDRLRCGCVLDFLTFNMRPLTIFGTFNVADVTISTGAVLLMIYGIRGRG